jgi:hypothetical protein
VNLAEGNLLDAKLIQQPLEHAVRRSAQPRSEQSVTPYAP